MPDPALYTVGLITAITTEFAAACAMLDSEEEEGPDYVSAGDTNSYTLGMMGKHNVVIASLPYGDYGTSSAAAVASNMLNSFPNIRAGVMVGIGGGAPTAKHDIRLGDIVVSARDGDNSIGSVFQYDFGKEIQDQDFKTTRLLNQPPPALLTALSNLRQFYNRKGHTLENDVRGAFAGSPGIQGTHSRPEPTTDRLYKSDYVHDDKCCTGSDGDNDPNLVARVARKEGEGKSVIHYGVIASANRLMKDARTRDEIANKYGALCFEMEAAGLMNHFPCLVVRGICDYSDSHKNKQWQGYAAMMAVAYTKCLLRRISPTRIEHERKLGEIVTSMQASVMGIHTTTQDMHASIKGVRIEHRDNKINNWLSHPDLNPSVNYNKAKEERIKDSTSGRWFLQSETFSKWKSRKNSSLWLHGMTGCGKTVLISTVLEYLEGTYENVLYFYFDFAQERKQSVDGMVRWLITQLSSKSKSGRKHIDSLYESHQQGNVQPDLRSLCETFQAMLEDSGQVWIILDALDECKLRQDPNGYPGCGLLSWIKSLASCELANMHLIFTSRPEQDIRSALDKWMDKEDRFPIEGRLIYGDIQNYIHTKIREHEGLERWHSRPRVLDEIESALLRRADGMFRWVACQLLSLEQCLDLSTLRDTLNALPTTLDATYARVLSNLPKTTKHLTVRILQFLTYSERPLKIAEAVDMVVVRTDLKNEDSWFKEDSRLPLPEEITRYCSSLVKVINKRDYLDRKIVPSIQLAHLSVKEYLISNRLEPTICNEFRDIVAKTCIMEVCLAYLLTLPANPLFSSFPFAEYAAEYWAPNAAFVEERSDSVSFFVRECLSRPYAFEACCRFYNPKNRPIRGVQSNYQSPSVLYYAVLMGLPNSVQMLLDQIADTGDKSQKLSGLLSVAIEQGHEGIACKLITSGANVDEGYPPPLFQAILGGYGEIVECLLDNGADVNAYHRPPLMVASEKGQKNVVRLLLKRGADPNAILQKFTLFGLGQIFHASYMIGSTALHHASLNGHEEVIQTLVDAGAKINTLIKGCYSKGVISSSNAPLRIYMSALSSASIKGHEAAVKTLIHSGAGSDSSGSLALIAASSAGHEKIVRILLDSGVDVDSREMFDAASPGMRQHEFSPLQVAAGSGHENVVRLLLSRGANVNLRLKSDRWSALRAAQWSRFTNTMRLLIDAGADVNDNGGRGMLPLQIAVSDSNEEMVKILIQRRVDIQAQGSKALYSAVSDGHEKIVRLLIRAGADVNKEAGEHGPALSVASVKGNENIFRAFVETGALANAGDSAKFAALCCASRTGSKDIATALLNNGAPPDLRGEQTSPLYLASTNGHIEIVEVLLERGACVDAHTKSDGPALEGASRNGKEDIVMTLIKTGADVNANSGLSLYSAARNGHESIVRILLNHSAHVNLINDTAHTPLAGACEGGHAAIFEMLLKSGADPSIVNQHGQTAFSAACAGGSMEICKTLLTHGASINDVGKETLYYASKEGHDQVVRLLIDLGCDVDSEYEGHGRPLLAACVGGHKTVVSTLLQHGAKVYGNFDRPIVVAVENRDREMVQMLRASYRKSGGGDPGHQTECTLGEKG